MTNQTLSKAIRIYNAGGVERVGAHAYRVASTSGETYTVYLSPRSYCTCATPRGLTCSHMAAADIAAAKRREVRAAAV